MGFEAEWWRDDHRVSTEVSSTHCSSQSKDVEGQGVVARPVMLST